WPMNRRRPDCMVASLSGGHCNSIESRRARGGAMPTDTAANKAIATLLFERFSAGDVAGALDLMSEDLAWWLPGKPDQVPTAGTRTKAEMAQIFKRMMDRMEGPLKMTLKGAIAEGDKVAVEGESLGHLKNGRVYNQEYHTLITIRDGKISAVREYLDTAHVVAVWYQPS